MERRRSRKPPSLTNSRFREPPVATAGQTACRHRSRPAALPRPPRRPSLFEPPPPLVCRRPGHRSKTGGLLLLRCRRPPPPPSLSLFLAFAGAAASASCTASGLILLAVPISAVASSSLVEGRRLLLPSAGKWLLSLEQGTRRPGCHA
jgi:hypothetical protein